MAVRTKKECRRGRTGEGGRYGTRYSPSPDRLIPAHTPRHPRYLDTHTDKHSGCQRQRAGSCLSQASSHPQKESRPSSSGSSASSDESPRQACDVLGCINHPGMDPTRRYKSPAQHSPGSPRKQGAWATHFHMPTTAGLSLHAGVFAALTGWVRRGSTPPLHASRRHGDKPEKPITKRRAWAVQERARELVG